MKTFSRLLLALAVIGTATSCGETKDKFTLTVTKTGAGSGEISATGISCGSDCSETFDQDTSVTLTAAPSSGSAFAGWTGCGSTSGDSCTVVMSQNRTVTAAFAVEGEQYTLTVAKTGMGGGTIAGDGISCGSDCTQTYPSGTNVALTATPNTGSLFGSWEGCTTTNGPTCTVTMSQDITVRARFDTGEVILISQDITTPTTWLTGKIYQVTAPIDVTSQLTLQPGVIVKLDANVSIRVTGTMVGDGQSALTPIIFTSSKTSPAGGDWKGVVFAASGSSMKYCAFYYAGADDDPALAIINGSAASITNCIFAHHRTTADSIAAAPALDASEAGPGTVIRDNIFYDNRVPLAISTKFSLEQNLFDNALAAPTAPQANKYNGVVVQGCGHVTTNITWPALPVPYVIGDPNSACNYIVVDNAGQLTLGTAAQNATLKFFPNGTLRVDGGIVPHAVFTSIRDDRFGGDTNGDGTASAPAPGDWRGLTLFESGTVFDNVAFFYGGGGDSSALRIGSDVSVTVTDSTFAYIASSDDAVTAPPALDAAEAGAATIIRGNTFYGNTVPLSINTTYSIDDTNTFVNPDAPAVGNKYQAIIVRGCGRIARSLTWSAIKVPLLIGDPNSACNYVHVETGGQLTLAENVVVKFFPGGDLTVQGTLTAVATTGRIVFTAYRDDANGGDTNADGAATTPAGGDWDGMNVQASGSRFQRVSFLYGGGATEGNDRSAIYVASDKSVSITDSIFAHIRPAMDSIRAPAAVDLTDAAPLNTVLTNNTFFDNTIPLAINARLSLDDSNKFDSGVSGALLPNRYQGIIVMGCGHIAASTTWLVTRLPLVIGDPETACNYMVVDGAGHLTLGPNVTLKFFLEGALYVEAGGLLTVAPSDWLTCIRDDHLTDTNADGAATVPSVGDWNGVKYYHSGAEPTCDQSSYMHYQLPNAGAECAW